MKKYFGTDGIRGKVGEYPITPEFFLRLGYATGKVLKQMTQKSAIVIGKDTRISGYLFESSLEAGFSYAGIDVYMVGPIPTPAISYLTRTLHLAAGVVISASHNPYFDNGIKFFSEFGTKLSDDIELLIEEELAKEMIKADSLGKVMRLEDARGRYIEFCKNTFLANVSLNDLKIILDCANGANYQIAPNVFRELGADVIAINCEPNGANINLNCGATDLKQLQQVVLQEKADFGIAFDGDGDRVIFIDNKAQIYNGDKLIYIILQGYLQQGKVIKAIVGTTMSNLALENTLKLENIELIRAKVGDRYVVEKLKENKLILGAEASGHILCLDKHSTGDGIIASLQVINALIILNKTLEEIVSWHDFPQTVINVPITPNWFENSRAIIEQAELDLGKNGRVLVRQSGTQALIRIMVEANRDDLAKEWAQKIVEHIS